MGTRSTINRTSPDGTVEQIYCHSDGYPSYNGRILRSSYAEQNKVDELFKLGSLSVLGKEIGEKHSFDERATSAICTAYGRDRGESDTESRLFDNLSVMNTEEYNYVWNGKEWYLWDETMKELRTLTDYMCEQD